MLRTEEQHHAAYRRAIVVSMVVLILLLSFMIVRPLIVAFISAAALAYIFYPVYKSFIRLLPKQLPRETLASILTCALVILIVLVPVSFITYVLTQEVRGGYQFLREVVKTQEFKAFFPPSIAERLGDLSQFKDIIFGVAEQVVGWLQGVLREVPNVILSIFVTIFSLFYLLKNAKDVYRFMRAYFPLPEGRYKQMFSRFDDLSRGMISGQILVGTIQGLLAWLGFVVLGVPSPVLWGFLTAIISIIPLMGAVLVWLPIAVFLFINGMITGAYWKGIALLVYGTFVISLIDNLLKPKIVGEHAKIHPLLVLFGMLGGIQLMGIPGLLIGPLILTLMDVTLEMLREVI